MIFCDGSGVESTLYSLKFLVDGITACFYFLSTADQMKGYFEIDLGKTNCF